MKRFMNKKVAAIGLAAGLVLGIAGAAVAYFSSTGSGTGSGLVGSSHALTINQTGITYNGPGGTSDTPKDFQPGDTSSVTWSVTNTGGSQAVNSVSLASWTSNVAGCDSTMSYNGHAESGWFSMPTVSESNQDVPTGTTALANGGTITFNDEPYAQDICEGAAITFSYTSN
jgi:hypothetical protein